MRVGGLQVSLPYDEQAAIRTAVAASQEQQQLAEDEALASAIALSLECAHDGPSAHDVTTSPTVEPVWRIKPRLDIRGKSDLSAILILAAMRG